MEPTELIRYPRASKRKNYMDPATLSVLGKAVADINRGAFQRLDDLLSEAVKIAETLSSDRPAENPKGLIHGRDFCLALSKAVMAYHNSIRDLQPSHPFRR